MSQLKNKLIPGAVLIYERADGVVYARYRDPPHNKIKRWVVGGDPGAVAKMQGDWVNWNEWQDLCSIAETNVTLKKQLDKLIQIYYIIKDDAETTN